MKTASLSQSKAFVVVTKSKNSELEKRCLDLDYIATQNGSWKLRHAENQEIFETDKEIKENGTALIWNSWDKFLGQMILILLVNLFIIMFQFAFINF